MLRIDRRSFLMTGSLGLGAFAIPGFAQTNSVPPARLHHRWLRGEPANDSMLLWTRFVPADGGAVQVNAEVSDHRRFREIVASGMRSPARGATTRRRSPSAGSRPARAISTASSPPTAASRRRADEDAARRPTRERSRRHLLLLEHAVRLFQRLCPCRGTRRYRPRDPSRRLFLRI